ncbi:MAG: GNAT family acetyltransferase [Sphingomonas sp.]|uniref:GNAT family acetyltransferase n=1 Tax=Sphingomonas sp. TaxID=28214 RepID=UPI0025D999B1|nr:GNAT family acetyltransferase [Sphingomonas sp.]MBX9883299.1 GNAT family acetyltransferase [Sphingomonas sp.]
MNDGAGGAGGLAPLSAADADAAIALWHEAGLTRPWNDPARDFARALAGPASTILGLKHDGALIATVMVGDDGHRGWLYYLAVAADARGQGHGRTVLRAAESWLAARGCPKAMLMIRGDNPVGGFYAAAGYATEDVQVMARWLKS